MITISRSLARQFRAIIRRCGLCRVHDNLPIAIRADGQGLTIITGNGNAAVEYREEGAYGSDEVIVSAEVLAAVEGRKEEPVTLQTRPGDKVLASWSDRGIPQRVELPAPCRKGTLTVLPEPEAIAGNEGRLWQALGDAVAASSNEAVRYALNCVQLCGSDGTLVATDGHQLLRQSGFTWPWDNEVLIPALGALGCPEVGEVENVDIGRAGDWAMVRAGRWWIGVRIDKNARFPKTDSLVRPATYATTRLELADSDREFLRQALPKLPGREQTNRPATLELNGRVAIRARQDAESSPTELVLTSSSYTGEPLSIAINRDFLGRLVAMGFDHLNVYGNDVPAQCDEAHRHYVIALLEPAAVIPASNNCLRIKSPLVVRRSHHQPRRNTIPMNTVPAPETEPTTPARTKRRIVSEAKPGTTIEQALALRDALRSAAQQAGTLVKSLRQHKRQQRIVETTLASLKELQKVAG